MIKIISYGKKHGALRDDMLLALPFDCTKLANPHFHPDLKALTGKDEQVQTFVQKDVQHEILLQKAHAAVGANIEGTIAFACIGGQHRSVAMAEMLQEVLANEGLHVIVEHRDI